MSVEPIEKVMRLWEASQITMIQAIGKILLLLQEHDVRLRKVEATQRNNLSKKRGDV